MFAYFFSFETEIPYGLGFRLYGIKHLLWLAGILLFLLSFCLYFRRQNDRRKNNLLNLIVILALCFTLGQDTILTATDKMNIRMLPFHLCDLATFIYLIQRLYRSRFLGEISACLLMPGALSAILFPEWTRYPMLNFMTIHGFLYHTLIVLYPLLLLCDRQICPRLSHIWQPVVFLVCLVPPIYLFDTVFQSNYMFLRYAPAGSPIKLLENLMGNPGYLLGYAGMIFLLLLLVYALFELFCRLRNRRRKKDG